MATTRKKEPMKNKQKKKRLKMTLLWMWSLDEIGPKPKNGLEC